MQNIIKPIVFTKNLFWFEGSMSGHSKWSTIKRKKGANDVKRAKIFTKHIRELTVAARMGGSDPSGNPRLRDALSEARAANMTKDTIERAVKRGTGELDGAASYEEVTYEGFGPGGVAVLIDSTTDNRTRTVADLRNLFSKNGGNLGESGCVGWLFERKGIITVSGSSTTEEKLMEAALDLGADDVSSDEEDFEVFTAPFDLDQIKNGLEKKGFRVLRSEKAAIPKTTLKLEGEKAQTMLELMEALEDHDDVQKVYTNFDMDL